MTALVVGLDPSLASAGIAVLRRTGHGNVDIADLRTVGHKTRNGKSYGHRSDRIVAQCNHILDQIPVDVHLVVLEGLSFGNNLPSHSEICALWWGLMSALRHRGVGIGVCAPGTRAKWACGSGNADKPVILAAVRAQWPDDHIRNHDEADAVALACSAAYRLGWTLPYTPGRAQCAAFDNIAWEAPR